MENSFNLSQKDLERLCERREVQSDSNKPLHPDEDFWDLCADGAEEIIKDVSLTNLLRDKIGMGGNVL